jgi:hypothetical protein
MIKDRPFSVARECLIALTILFILSVYSGIIIFYKKSDDAVYYVEAYICAISILLCIVNLLSSLTVWLTSQKGITYKALITVLGFLPFLILKYCVIILDTIGYTLRG